MVHSLGKTQILVSSGGGEDRVRPRHIARPQARWRKAPRPVPSQGFRPDESYTPSSARDGCVAGRSLQVGTVVLSPRQLGLRA